MKSALNENIKRLREACALTQVEFAKKIGVTKQCISNWENDNVLPSIEMLEKLADFFGVTTDYLLGRSDRQTVDVSLLTSEQCGHIRLLILDLENANKK